MSKMSERTECGVAIGLCAIVAERKVFIFGVIRVISSVRFVEVALW